MEVLVNDLYVARIGKMEITYYISNITIEDDLYAVQVGGYTDDYIYNPVCIYSDGKDLYTDCGTTGDKVILTDTPKCVVDTINKHIESYADRLLSE